MRTLFDFETTAGIISRIERLKPSAKPEWGKMHVAQMLAHCSAVLDSAAGVSKPVQHWMGMLLGRLWKTVYYNEEPFDRNSTTDPTWIISNERDFETEKAHLIQKIRSFQQGGEEKCTTHPHPFFGKLTPEQWGVGMYKHLDHHLRQFDI